jgi:hypothetical protein
MFDGIKESSDIRIKHPVYLPLRDPDPDRIQGLMRVSVWSKSAPETEQSLFIDLV